jgi:hydrogenase nickel incorporation protein HypA/HybF
MHEMSIVQALIEQVGAELEKAGHDGRVVGLDLVVGRLSGVNPDALRFAFELLAPGTLVDGTELRVTEPAAVISCRACGARQSTVDLAMRCAACGDDRITIEGGQDLLLQSIELEE